MTAFLGPVDSVGRIPPRQQTRVASFLVSAHGALARQLAFVLPTDESGWQTELNAQFFASPRSSRCCFAPRPG
jgi:hypothetical protein